MWSAPAVHLPVEPCGGVARRCAGASVEEEGGGEEAATHLLRVRLRVWLRLRLRLRLRVSRDRG